MEARRVFRPLFFVLCLLGTALGLNNTYGDDTELKALAERTACASEGCSVRTLSVARSAFKQRYGFQTSLVEKGKTDRRASVDVECQRAYVMVGEYHCAIESGGFGDAR